MTTHPTFIRLLFLIVVSLLITATGFAANKKPQNTVILLDLSDRIIQPGQLSKRHCNSIITIPIFERMQCNNSS
ncbi:MAG: hypothetical protein IPO63_17660 [Bacteroidetes bacterium]|nr:hypothetical protein [Bacteroidota bacterium]